MMGGSFKKLFAKVKDSIAYKKEKAKVDFAVDLTSIIRKRGIKRSELARRLDVSPAYITKILSGEYNFTIEKIVDIAEALDTTITVHITPKEENVVDWYRIVQAPSAKSFRAKRVASRGKRKIECLEASHKTPIFEGDNGYPIAA